MFKSVRYGIKTKLIIIYLLIAIPLLILLSISLYNRFRGTQEDVLRDRFDIARLSSSNFTLFIDQTMNAEKAIGSTIVDHNLSVNTNNAFLSRVVQNHPASNLAFLNKNGIVIAASIPRTIGQNRSGRPAIRQILNGKDTAVGNLQRNADGQPGFVIATAIKRDGSLQGIVSMSIATNELGQVLDIAVRQGGVNIVDATGMLIFDARTPSILFDERDWSDEEFVQAALSGKTFMSTGLVFPIDNSFRMGVEIPITSIGWATGSFVPVELVLGPIRRDAVINSLIALLILGISLSLAYILGNRIANALITLKNRMTEAPQTGFTKRVEITTGDEIEELANSFNWMQDEILTAQAVQQKLQEELREKNEELSALYEKQRDIAVILQTSLLSKIEQRVDHLEIGSNFQSATEAALVGGDFFDFFEIPEDKFGIIMGDVSGKGIEASTLAAAIRNTLRAFAYEGADPAAVVERVNRIAVIETPPSVFITLFFGIFDSRSRTLVYANAGHWPPVIYKPDEKTFETLEIGGLPLGAFSSSTYTNFSSKLMKGLILTLYTDGIVEAKKGAEFFGIERLEQAVSDNHSLSPDNIAKAVIERARSFGGGKLYDDAAVMVIRVI